MSQTNSQSQYSFNIATTVTASGNTDQTTWTAYSQNGMTDTLASQIIWALRGITPPAGMTISATVSKQDVTDVVYTTGYVNPLTFT